MKKTETYILVTLRRLSFLHGPHSRVLGKRPLLATYSSPDMMQSFLDEHNIPEDTVLRKDTRKGADRSELFSKGPHNCPSCGGQASNTRWKESREEHTCKTCKEVWILTITKEKVCPTYSTM